MKGSAPLIVTVVTPSYNQGEFLDATVRSVLSQAGDFVLEYVVMDGGSTDESVAILQRYEALLRESYAVRTVAGLDCYVATHDGDPFCRCLGVHFRWQSKPDGGQVRALNTAFANARGTFATWLNSDDFYCSDRALEGAVAAFAEDPGLDIVAGDGVIVDRSGAPVWEHAVVRISPRELLYLDYHLLQPASLFRIELVRQNPFREDFAFTFDTEFFNRVLTRGARIRKIPHRMAAYRLYGENISDREHWDIYRQKLRIARLHGGGPALAAGVVYLSFAYYLNRKLESRRGYESYRRYFFRPFQEVMYRALLGEGYDARYGKGTKAGSR